MPLKWQGKTGLSGNGLPGTRKQREMNHPSSSFLTTGAWCAFGTAVTTILVHKLFTMPADFEQQIFVYKSSLYKARNWITVAHCLLVLISMTAVMLVLRSKAPVLAGFGLFFFAVFALTEIVRMFLALYYANGLREMYATATDPALRNALRLQLQVWGLIGNTLFNLFFLAFALGNCCFGTAFLSAKGLLHRVVGWVLMAWGAINLASFLNDQFQWMNAARFMEYFSIIFQPLARALLALLLWLCARPELPGWKKSGSRLRQV
jgi:hypothetical protein